MLYRAGRLGRSVRNCDSPRKSQCSLTGVFANLFVCLCLFVFRPCRVEAWSCIVPTIAIVPTGWIPSLSDIGPPLTCSSAGVRTFVTLLVCSALFVHPSVCCSVFADVVDCTVSIAVCSLFAALVVRGAASVCGARAAAAARERRPCSNAALLEHFGSLLHADQEVLILLLFCLLFACLLLFVLC